MPRRPRIRRWTGFEHLQVDGASYRLPAVGPYVTSGISGKLIAKRDAIRQRGVWVYRRSWGEVDTPSGRESDD